LFTDYILKSRVDKMMFRCAFWNCQNTYWHPFYQPF